MDPWLFSNRVEVLKIDITALLLLICNLGIHPADSLDSQDPADNRVEELPQRKF